MKRLMCSHFLISTLKALAISRKLFACGELQFSALIMWQDQGQEWSRYVVVLLVSMFLF